MTIAVLLDVYDNAVLLAMQDLYLQIIVFETIYAYTLFLWGGGLPIFEKKGIVKAQQKHGHEVTWRWVQWQCCSSILAGPLLAELGTSSWLRDGVKRAPSTLCVNNSELNRIVWKSSRLMGWSEIVTQKATVKKREMYVKKRLMYMKKQDMYV